MKDYSIINIPNIPNEKNIEEFIKILSQLTDVGNLDTQDIYKFIDTLNDNHLIYWVMDQNKVIATGTLLIESKFIHNFGKVGHIEDIVVDVNYRGKGIGKTLIEYLLTYAQKIGCYKVILNSNENTSLFYKKCGFQKMNVQMAKYFNG